MNTLLRVLRDEGWQSAARRTRERLGESAQRLWQNVRGCIGHGERAPVLNVCGMPVLPRLGGLPIQLATRLAAEARQRTVALYEPGRLRVGGQARPCGSLAVACARTGAAIVHIEGTSGMDLAEVLALPIATRLLLSLHDLALLDAPAALRTALFARCTAVLYPSDFLARAYAVRGRVLAPPTPATAPRGTPRPDRLRVAYVGAAKRHKGAALLPELIATAAPDLEWHVCGGGDAERLLAALRGRARVRVHGYVCAARIPRLLRRHCIGVALLPSLVPESFSLTLSECWLAGVPAIAFDHGALGERIRLGQGAPWLAPSGSGVEGLRDVLAQWRAGSLAHPALPAPTPADHAAMAMCELYRGLLPE